MNMGAGQKSNRRGDLPVVSATPDPPRPLPGGTVATARGKRESAMRASLAVVASLASFPAMMKRDRRHEGLRVCRAAWLVGCLLDEKVVKN